MKIFPTQELKFKLIDSKEISLNRLNRRTEKTENLTSQDTDKSFRGVINGNEFKLISSRIGSGAFCVLTGVIEAENGKVQVEIHKVFRILLSVIMFLPIIGIIVPILTGAQEVSTLLVLIALGQVFVIRYVFIAMAFKFLSKESLNRLRDVLDFDWIGA